MFIIIIYLLFSHLIILFTIYGPVCWFLKYRHLHVWSPGQRAWNLADLLLKYYYFPATWDLTFYLLLFIYFIVLFRIIYIFFYYCLSGRWTRDFFFDRPRSMWGNIVARWIYVHPLSLIYKIISLVSSDNKITLFFKPIYWVIFIF